MAILEKGLYGSFTGKAGNMVGRNLGGQHVLTGEHEKPKTPLTVKQMDYFAKFAMVSNFLSYISELISLGFKPAKRKHSPMNIALSYNLEHAVTDTGPDWKILFPKLSISKGSVEEPLRAEAKALPAAVLEFTWAAGMITRHNNYTDTLMLMVYNPLKKAFVTQINAAERRDLSYSLQLPVEFAGDQVHCYLSFIGYKKQASDSIYVGPIQII